MIYYYPKFDGIDLIFLRLGGPGLGNLLFPWARALVLAEKHGGKLIHPAWPQVKIGPVLRRESDLRHYADLFRADQNSVAGLRKAKLLLSARKVLEVDVSTAAPGDVVLVQGMEDLFSSLVGHAGLIRSALLRMCRPRLLAGVEVSKGCLAVHVRLGDFSAPVNPDQSKSGAWNTRIGIDWYRAAIAHAQEAHGGFRQILLFSDGTDEELADLLSIPGVRRFTVGRAISDIIALSNADCLIASGSSFSMWASFLGQKMTIWHPGQLRQRLHDSNETEYEFSP